jgi:single-stranded-DNA-specific exonuclease
MRDENRVFAYYGLKVLRKTRRIGLLALYQKLRLDAENINEDDIGFMVAPRINTASRMDHATTSFNLLVTENPEEAKWIASHLEGKNGERKKAVQIILDSVENSLSPKGKIPEVVVAGNLEWLPGVLGLAANRLMDKYHRPVFLWGKADAHEIKGSCRSDGSVNLVALMEEMQGFFIEFGGHALAGGFSLKEDKKDIFEQEALKAFSKAKKQEAGSAVLEIDSEITLDDVNMQVWESIEKFAPFGMENPKPVFLLKGIEIANAKSFGNGGIHLELGFKKPGGEIVRAVGFFMDGNKFSDADVAVGGRIDLVANMERSTFAGRDELRLRIVDIRRTRC